jgi:hypothetical protein
MAQQTVPIPGEILKTTVIFGLTFDELMVLAALPLVLVLPSAMIDAVPIWISGVTVALGFVGVLAIVYKTPPGQSPVEWFPAYMDRKIKPDRFVLKPQDNTKYGAPEINYQDVVHTANLIEEEDEATPELVEKLTNEIDGADKLERPEWAESHDSEETDVLGAVAEKVKP